MAPFDTTVNPHFAPGPRRLTRILDGTLDDLIRLRRSADVPDSRLRLAGVPPLLVLKAERQRRVRTHGERAS
jgi:hypothetical protein